MPKSGDNHIDQELYGALLARVRPGLIETPEEHERLLTEAEALMDKAATMSAEERKLLELLAVLIELFESEVQRDDDEEEADDEHTLPSPSETLRRLMEARGLQPVALNDVFGNAQIVSEVLASKRPISRGQSKALGKLFSVPYKLFLSGQP